jgi:putative ABC transport system permease protein
VSALDLLRIAVQGFSRHRLRALLTALGIIIGVGAFITMVAIGQGATRKVAEQIASMGTNLIIVQGGTSSVGTTRGSLGTASLTDGDAVALREQCDEIRYVAPMLNTGGQLMWGGANWRAPITGTTPDYLKVRNWTIDQGEFFTQRDVDTGNKVCVLGATTAEGLFGGEEPLGQTIRVRALTCQVIGVLTAKGQSQMGQDQDDIVLMPLTTGRRKLFNTGPATASAVSRILLSARSGETTQRAVRQAQGLLRQRHRAQEGDPEDPVVRDLTEYTNVAKETTRTMTLLLAGIAAVSLIVGGIGIMNIMLVSVTERTREIGIRMAVGAKGRQVLWQFLLEAMVLTTLGGLVGMALGTVAANLVARVMEWPAELNLGSYGIGFSFSMLVGVVFGFYPAWRASRLDPIEALRYE